ncbi:MAG: electron transfer flavoprotein subunit beta/FixA family protein [Proteobacteria bacterium]|nr:electron transfer flavoprotein subunit beta/FixA family protein [Pseudomonadota bacterium]MBU1742189.1 electron transfer flavoprotein subunit beta/FixA family protein [Pseudomonadota bacterium]
MNVVVCCKRVPETAEADLVIAPDGRRVSAKGLVYDINEWDNYAVEEAVRLKEALGGTVTVVTVGGAEGEDVLRRGLAMGADAAWRLDAPDADEADGWALARTLAEAVKDLRADLVLCGVQAADNGYAQVGPALAALLGMPHATMVIGLAVEGGGAKVRRELEGGWEEEVEIDLPAVLTIQSGINQPRYVSVLGIRKVRRKPIEVKPAQSAAAGSNLVVERLTEPEIGAGAEMIEGSLDECAQRLVAILAERGGVL